MIKYGSAVKKGPENFEILQTERSWEETKSMKTPSLLGKNTFQIYTLNLRIFNDFDILSPIGHSVTFSSPFTHSLLLI